MAILKITRLNKLTCGNRRGLVDMNIQIQGILPDVYLLPGTNIRTVISSVSDYDNAGIATESNVDYQYFPTEAISDYYTANAVRSLIQESTASDLILNEDQKCIDVNTWNGGLSAIYDDDGELVLSGSSAIQLTPEFYLSAAAMYDKAFAMNTQLSSIRVVYEFELDTKRNIKAMLEDTATGLQTFPLNDLLDLCIKSMFKKSYNNRAIPGNLMLDDGQVTPNRNVDQYFVFEGNPVSFCQFKGDAFLISPETTDQPYRMESNLKSQLLAGVLNEAHQFSLVQHPLSTVLYPSIEDYGVSSYAEYIHQDRARREMKNVIDMFTPARYVTGIGYNYIVQIEQNKNYSTQNDNPTLYDNGDIYGFFTTGKNMYNALYSTEMSSSDAIQNCREYIGVQEMGSQLLLKFFDDCDYKIDYKQNARLLSTSSSVTDLYPYQKVESYNPTRFGHGIRHKSTLFSVKIFNSGLDSAAMDSYSAEQQKIAESLKKSINNAMQQLADSIAPANTQLFDTYFMESD